VEPGRLGPGLEAASSASGPTSRAHVSSSFSRGRQVSGTDAAGVDPFARLTKCSKEARLKHPAIRFSALNQIRDSDRPLRADRIILAPLGASRAPRGLHKSWASSRCTPVRIRGQARVWASSPPLKVLAPRTHDTRRVLSQVCGKFEAGLRRIAEVQPIEL
jgi:hypothetical protein